MVPGEAVAPPSVRKRARAQALRCSAVLEGAALRYDDIVEGQIGDAIVFPGLVDLSIFGSKTDSTLSGQPSVTRCCPTRRTPVRERTPSSRASASASFG